MDKATSVALFILNNF